MLFKITYFSIEISNWIPLFFYQDIEQQPDYRYQFSSLCRSIGISKVVSGLNFSDIYMLKGYKNSNNKFGTNFLWNSWDNSTNCRSSRYRDSLVHANAENTILHTSQRFYILMCSVVVVLIETNIPIDIICDLILSDWFIYLMEGDFSS